jgi:ATP-dependent DNA helicase RecG
MHLPPTAKSNIHTLLDSGLGPNLHWFPENVSTSKLAETMVGMANKDGGTILIGIAPRSGKIQGVMDIPANLDLINQAALLSDPHLVLPLATTHMIGGATVLRLSIPSSLPHVYSLNGRYLERQGQQTIPLPPRKLRSLLIERGSVEFESRVYASTSINDLDLNQVDAYLETLKLPYEEKFEDVLIRRRCLEPDEERLRPTYAGLLLFGKHPQRWFPNAGFLAAHFPGTTFSDKFIKLEIGGTLPQQLRQSEQFIRENIRTVVRLNGLIREEFPEYPLEGVRELLVNAVAHRDYSIQGDSIHLNIFADRLEIHSPGELPGPVNLDNLLIARFSRNPIIVQVLSDLGFIERLGYGLNRVVTVMKQSGLQKPKFQELSGTFRVTLFGESPTKSQIPDLSRYQTLDLNKRQKAALSYLATFNRITNRSYQELCPDVHSETLRRDLVDLVKRGIIIKVGDKRATYYILK